MIVAYESAKPVTLHAMWRDVVQPTAIMAAILGMGAALMILLNR